MTTTVLELSPAEVAHWPGVWAATRTFAGWVLQADNHYPEAAAAAARRLSDLTGCTVVVEGLTIYR